MTPYWTSADGRHTLYHGDCLAVMPTLPKVDAVMTIPPYNTLPTSGTASGLHAERKTGVNQWIARAQAGYFDSMPELEYQYWLVCVFLQCFLVCDGLVWINHKIRYRDGEAIHPARMFPWPIYTEIIWDRGSSMALNCKRYAPSTEHLIGFGKPVVWNDELNTLMSVWRIGFDRDQNDHPCAFPVALAERPIRSSTRPASRVLDPFAGSGTTGVACIRTGRRSIMIEMEERYCEIAARRMEAELAQPMLIPLAIEKPVQDNLFEVSQ